MASQAALTPDRDEELTGELERLAEAHLRDARQLGELGIAQTQNGLLKLVYDRASRTYTLTQFDGSGIVLAAGRKAVVKAQLVQLYTID